MKAPVVPAHRQAVRATLNWPLLLALIASYFMWICIGIGASTVVSFVIDAIRWFMS
jgi:hypothetical protein